MTGYVTPLGSAVLTLIDPDRGAEVEFNRWYERDHFYGGALLGPGVLAGGRFVARAVEKRHRVADDPDVGTLLNAYWLADDGSTFWPWCVEQIPVLIAAGRMTAPGKVKRVWWLPAPWAEASAVDGVPPALALDRRYPAVVLALVSGDADTYRGVARTLCERPGVGLVVGDVPRAVNFRHGPAAALDVVLGLWFLTSAEAAAEFGVVHDEAVTAAGADVRWRSAFVGTVPGTDTHLDSLWLASSNREESST
ncbi:hypothetical protein [Sporichthya polymorpha]|uniref:hypothetical protein n=1 Tax=Sporichthya polymorpha TaxID=35751 RepID=UPI00037DC712|nr:hypothetical protein [Sporichthya polymorpha]